MWSYALPFPSKVAIAPSFHKNILCFSYVVCEDGTCQNRHQSNEDSILKKLINYDMNLLTSQSMSRD